MWFRLLQSRPGCWPEVLKIARPTRRGLQRPRIKRKADELLFRRPNLTVKADFFSPMPRMAPPPVGRLSEGGARKNESCLGTCDQSGAAGAERREPFDPAAESPTVRSRVRRDLPRRSRSCGRAGRPSLLEGAYYIPAILCDANLAAFQKACLRAPRKINGLRDRACEIAMTECADSMHSVQPLRTRCT